MAWTWAREILLSIFSMRREQDLATQVDAAAAATLAIITSVVVVATACALDARVSDVMSLTVWRIAVGWWLIAS